MPFCVYVEFITHNISFSCGSVPVNVYLHESVPFWQDIHARLVAVIVKTWNEIQQELCIIYLLRVIDIKVTGQHGSCDINSCRATIGCPPYLCKCNSMNEYWIAVSFWYLRRIGLYTSLTWVTTTQFVGIWEKDVLTCHKKCSGLDASRLLLMAIFSL